MENIAEQVIPSEEANSKKSFLDRYDWQIVCFIIIASFYRTIFLRGFTAWDTFDLYTATFTYMSDALKGGDFALWNPFILSGIPLLPNLVTSSSFGLIDLIQLIFGTLISPEYLVEWQIIGISVLFGLGNLSLFKMLGNSSTASLIASLMAHFILVPPIVGQFSFIFSFALAPWLYFLLFSTQERSFLQEIFFAFLFSFIFIKGYFYFNGLIFLILGFLFLWKVIFEKYRTWFRLCYFILPSLLYLLFFGEALTDWNSLYADLAGDLVSKEPRIRSLVPPEAFFYFNFKGALLVLLSYVGDGWTWGFKYFSPLFIICSSLFLFFKNYKVTEKIFLFSLIALSLLISSNDIKPYWDLLPFFKSFRWGFCNIYLGLYIGCFLVAFSLTTLGSFSQKIFVKWFYRALCTLGFLAITGSLALCVKKSVLFGKSHLNKNQYPTVMLKRKKEAIHKENSRFLNSEKEFQFTDFSWVAQKRPISHGYNNTISDLYWRIKDTPLIGKILHFPERSKIYEKSTRKTFASDDAFLHWKSQQIDSTGKEVLIEKDLNFTGKISPTLTSFSLTPNKLIFSTNSTEESFALITQHFHFGWTALVNGKKQELYKSNYLFQGLQLPAGKNTVILSFWPKTAWGILFLYIIFMAVTLLIIKDFYQKRRKENEKN